MKKILVTGGAGFIGSNLSLRLISKGYTVKVLDSLSKQVHGENYDRSPLYQNIKDKVQFIKASIESRECIEKAIQNQDAIIHLAAETGTGQSMYEIEKYNSVNILGTAILWDILANKKHSINKVVVASSRAIYGEGKYVCNIHGNVYPYSRKDEDMKKGDFNVKCPYCNENVTLMATTEDSKIHPTSIYGFTKQAQEEMSMIAGKALNIPVVAFRYQNVYGPGQSLSNPYTGILSIFSTRIKNSNEISIFEDGKESRDFVYIDDVIDATILGLEKEEANYESFNVGTGKRTDVLEVANTLKEKYNSNVEVKITGNYRLGDIRDNYADNSKIEKILGYKAKVSFKEGIFNFIDWVNTQSIQKDNYLLSIEEMKRKGLYK